MFGQIGSILGGIGGTLIGGPGVGTAIGSTLGGGLGGLFGGGGSSGGGGGSSFDVSGILPESLSFIDQYLEGSIRNDIYELSDTEVVNIPINTNKINNSIEI